MLTTAILITIFVVSLFINLLMWGGFLWCGLRWVKCDHVTVRRIIITVVVILCIKIPLAIFLGFTESWLPDFSFILDLLTLCVFVGVSIAVVKYLFRLTLRRAFLAWIPTLIGQFALIFLAFFVVRPFLVEAFVIPTNSMAPTMLGHSFRSTCSECGELNYCTPFDPEMATYHPAQLICNRFHITEQEDVPSEIFGGDRVLALKTLASRRWDVIVFQYPERPETLYAMRLVGLPGETIVIKNGSVWANGKQLELPESLRGLEYTNIEGFQFQEVWGTEENPAVLDRDEYFVLGDNSAISRDSRLWNNGAPGYHPYAVPKSYIQGVVTHIYWPPERWRVLR